MIEFVRSCTGCSKVQSGLHPRTGFMIFFPGAILIGLAILGLVAPWGHPMNLSAWEGLGATLAIDTVVVLSLRRDDLGNAIQWDDHAIYIRQNDPDWGRWRNKGFARIPYESIESVEARGCPKGVPPLYPILEVLVRKEELPPRTHILIDPNYFRV